MKSIATIAALVLAAAPAAAAEPAPPINIVFSADNASCAAWTKSAGNKLIRQQYEMWARGFVSGHNYANPAQQVKVGAFPSGEDFYQYFDQYCRGNPQHTFVAAAIQLVEQLAAPAAETKPAPARKQPAKAPASVPAK